MDKLVNRIETSNFLKLIKIKNYTFDFRYLYLLIMSKVLSNICLYNFMYEKKLKHYLLYAELVLFTPCFL